MKLDEPARLRIGDVAREAGVSTRALRYYEEAGLLPAGRTSSGQRHYDEGAVPRVRLIQQLFAAGLSSRSILVLLPCVDSGRATTDMLDTLIAERARIHETIQDLSQALSQLDDIITATRSSVAP